jgi:octaprenyl-diphosphate synthase
MESPDTQTEADLPHAMALMERHGALRDTIARARHYGDVARDALRIFPDSPIRRALDGAIAYAFERTR